MGFNNIQNDIFFKLSNLLGTEEINNHWWLWEIQGRFLDTIFIKMLFVTIQEFIEGFSKQTLI